MPVRRLLDHFDTTYDAVLDTLETAWDGGDPSALRAAVHAMRGLETPAVELMEISVPSTRGISVPARPRARVRSAATSPPSSRTERPAISSGVQSGQRRFPDERRRTTWD